jgi:hypothetical protein
LFVGRDDFPDPIHGVDDLCGFVGHEVGDWRLEIGWRIVSDGVKNLALWVRGAGAKAGSVYAGIGVKSNTSYLLTYKTN